MLVAYLLTFRVRTLAALLAAGALGACATHGKYAASYPASYPTTYPSAAPDSGKANPAVQPKAAAPAPSGISATYEQPPDVPRITRAARPLQCVPYAREASGIEIFGNANRWWKNAAGKYRRGRSPVAGSVIVFKGSRQDPRGHVAVVRSIEDSRNILIDHANWFGGGEIYLATPVRDVSPNNDWSEVRVWWLPGDQWGARTFHIAGFIYREPQLASR